MPMTLADLNKIIDAYDKDKGPVRKFCAKHGLPGGYASPLQDLIVLRNRWGIDGAIFSEKEFTDSQEVAILNCFRNHPIIDRPPTRAHYTAFISCLFKIFPLSEQDVDCFGAIRGHVLDSHAALTTARLALVKALTEGQLHASAEFVFSNRALPKASFFLTLFSGVHSATKNDQSFHVPVGAMATFQLPKIRSIPEVTNQHSPQ